MMRSKALLRDGVVVPMKICAVEEHAITRDVATQGGFVQEVVNVYLLTLRVVGAPLEAYLEGREDGEQPEFRLYGWARGGKWGDRPLAKESLPAGSQYVDWLPHVKEPGDTLDRILDLGGYWAAVDAGAVLFPLPGVLHGRVVFHVNPGDASKYGNYLHKVRGERGAVAAISVGGPELLAPPPTTPTTLSGLRRKGAAAAAPAESTAPTGPTRATRPAKGG